MSEKQRYSNRLIHETSPYLLQHAHNPVDWFAWGKEALEKAQSEDKPIFLSVGYSACHWCHVMEKESFEDEQTAQLMNASFINIKVDREERPDIDSIYMTAVQMMTRHGGWPMSVFLTPAGEPIFGGTYFPPQDRHGMPSFKRVLAGVANAWQEKREEVRGSAKQFRVALQQMLASTHQTSDTKLDIALIEKAATFFLSQWDRDHGGFGNAPKFFHSVDYRLLLRHWKRTGDQAAIDATVSSLKKIADGGIFDHLGGGFHRYSTDETWLVPHFEKMLYDNALMTRTYLEAYQATGEPQFRKVACDTLDYVLREMTSSDGAFFSTQDADSEGVEGKFFVWSESEIKQILGSESALFCRAYGVSEIGNWEETNILHRTVSLEELAKEFGKEVASVEKQLASNRAVLFEKRKARIAPGLDDKVLVSWNGLMIQTLAKATFVLGDDRYHKAAECAANFILEEMSQFKEEAQENTGALFHTYKDGQARFTAYLDDFACFTEGLLCLYEGDTNPLWLTCAERMMDYMIEHFWDPSQSCFFYTSHNHEKLIVRTKELHDGATPSSNAMAATALVHLGRVTTNAQYLTKAEKMLSSLSENMEKSPAASAQLLLALDDQIGDPKELIFYAGKEQKAIQSLKEKLAKMYLPTTIAIFASEDSDFALTQGKKSIQGQITLYLCEKGSCQLPVTGQEDIERVLGTLSANR